MSLGRVVGVGAAAPAAPPPGLITADAIRQRFAEMDGAGSRAEPQETYMYRPAAAPLHNASPLRLESRGPAQPVSFARPGVNVGPVDGVIVDADAESAFHAPSALPFDFGRPTPRPAPSASAFAAASVDPAPFAPRSAVPPVEPVEPAASEPDLEAVDDEDLPPAPDDAVPVVPDGLVHTRHVAGSEFQWQLHPAHGVVLSLLKKRGVTQQRHGDIVEYHMAELFLDALAMLSRGAYFMRFGKGSPPKERFVALRLIEGEDNSGKIPVLGLYTNHKSLNMTDFVRIDNLVGQTKDTTSAEFRKHLLSPTVIKGSYVGSHHARVSTQGCFSLWFFDRRAGKPRSVDLLTTNLTVFARWTAAFDGLLSVNSTYLERPTAAQDIQRLFDLTLQELTQGSDAR